MYAIRLSFRSASDYERELKILRDYVRARSSESSELITLQLDVPSGEVSLLIRVSNLYAIGVKNSHATFYFKDSSPGRLIDNQVLLGFGGHYNDLGRYVSLGSLEQPRFLAAAGAASHWKKASPPSSFKKDSYGQKQQSADAGHLLRLILATSEAVRFPAVGLTVANALEGRRDSPLKLAEIDVLVRDWEKLSGQGSPEVAVSLKR